MNGPLSCSYVWPLLIEGTVPSLAFREAFSLFIMTTACHYLKDNYIKFMFFKLFLLFTLGPMVELYFLIKIGGMIGALNTILIILMTGFAGALLAQAQGLSVLFEIQKATQEGRMPLEEMMDGAFVLVGGFLLITPGFVTDIAGFIFLVPLTRNFLKLWLKKYLEKNIKRDNVIIDIHRQ